MAISSSVDAVPECRSELVASQIASKATPSLPALNCLKASGYAEAIVPIEDCITGREPRCCGVVTLVQGSSQLAGLLSLQGVR